MGNTSFERLVKNNVLAIQAAVSLVFTVWNGRSQPPAFMTGIITDLTEENYTSRDSGERQTQKKYILLAESRSDLYKDVRSQRKDEKGN